MGYNAFFVTKPDLAGGFGLQRQRQPLAAPFGAFGLRHGAAAGVVAPDLADALRAQSLQPLVEFFAAETEGLQVGSVTQRDHAVADMAEKLWTGF